MIVLPMQQKQQRFRHVVVIILSLLLSISNGQRFMRQGFTNNEDFSAEMRLDENEPGVVDMTREMFILQNLQLQIQPIDYYDGINTNNNNNNIPFNKKRTIQKYLNQPVSLKLYKKRGKFGYRAVGSTLNNGKKLRAFWRQSVQTNDTLYHMKNSDFLKLKYDDAIKYRLFNVEFEIQLPKKMSIIYQVPMDSGNMNTKAIVPREKGNVYLKNNITGSKQNIGKAIVTVSAMKPGLIDPTWAKGRKIFRKGRNAGLI